MWDHQFVGTKEVAILQAVENENIDILNIDENKHELVKTQNDFFKGIFSIYIFFFINNLLNKTFGMIWTIRSFEMKNSYF